MKHPAPHRLARGGPYLRNRLPAAIKIDQGREVFLRHILGETPIREVAKELGMSPTTAWRRSWFYIDTMWWPLQRDLPRSHIPPQRGTRGCPTGEPPTLNRDAAPRRIRHPLPSTRCRAERRNGARCRRWAVRGATICPVHGGRHPAVQEAAAHQVANAEIADRVARRHIRADGLRVQDLRARMIAARERVDEAAPARPIAPSPPVQGR